MFDLNNAIQFIYKLTNIFCYFIDFSRLFRKNRYKDCIFA